MQRLAAVLERLEARLPTHVPTDFAGSIAFRWRKRRLLSIEQGELQAVERPALIAFDDLKHVDQQKEEIRSNTERFVRGLPSNNVLLTGARGTGKSSLIRACLHAFSAQGVRLIEVDKRDLVDVADIVDRVASRAERFIVFCDDLSFDTNEAGYKELKVALDGSIAGAADNVLIYASSNRRHLMPEPMRDNLGTRYDEEGEIHPTEAVEERISLSERFGLWLSFYPFRQDDYLDIASHWLARFGLTTQEVAQARAEALQFALQRGSRSGRVALQFARHWAGNKRLSSGDGLR
ncbi:MAG: ATP-binding protein [Burkholderiaceae bacterium]|nr:ATP-binding protein [Burkholderiaceae bacterium]